MLQWSHVFSDMVSWGAPPQPGGDTHASMEPCLFRHGKGTIRRSGTTKPNRLQWSHVFSDMVRVFILSRFRQHVSLQWSHVFSDMVRSAEAVPAGPGWLLQWSHVFSDMVSKKSDPYLFGVDLLQWSHVFSDMVRDPGGRRRVVRCPMLQWSHVFSDMVRAGDRCVDDRGILASMEPCLFRHGKRLQALAAENPYRGFNGAMSFQTW